MSRSTQLLVVSLFFAGGCGLDDADPEVQGRLAIVHDNPSGIGAEYRARDGVVAVATRRVVKEVEDHGESRVVRYFDADPSATEFEVEVTFAELWRDIQLTVRGDQAFLDGTDATGVHRERALGLFAEAARALRDSGDVSLSDEEWRVLSSLADGAPVPVHSENLDGQEQCQGWLDPLNFATQSVSVQGRVECEPPAGGAEEESWVVVETCIQRVRVGSNPWQSLILSAVEGQVEYCKKDLFSRSGGEEDEMFEVELDVFCGDLGQTYRYWTSLYVYEDPFSDERVALASTPGLRMKCGASQAGQTREAVFGAGGGRVGPPSGNLTSVSCPGGSSITVDSSLANSLGSLLSAASSAGVRLCGWGYRDSQRQIELRRAHCGTSHYAVYLAPASTCSPPTARPGQSMHEKGLAVDFENCGTRSTNCYKWLSRNAASYGLHNLPSESWHWSTNGR